MFRRKLHRTRFQRCNSAVPNQAQVDPRKEELEPGAICQLSHGGCSFPGWEQHARKAGPEALDSNPCFCSALPKLAGSKRTTMYFRTAGDLGDIGSFT